MDKHVMGQGLMRLLATDDLNVSYKDNPMKSDGSFIYFQEKHGDFSCLKEKILTLPWVEAVVLQGHHLNFYLPTRPMAIPDCDLEKIVFEKPVRLYQLMERLREEVKAGHINYPERYRALVKAYNLCLVAILEKKSVSVEALRHMVLTFKKADLAFMYRRAPQADLRGILEILKACVALIERTSHE